MTALCSQAYNAPQFSMGYQSKLLDNELDLNWYDFEARSYDPQLGRFLQQDPEGQFASGYTGMGNNWVSNIDPNGKFVFLAPIIIGAVTGAFFGGVQADMQGKSVLAGIFKGAFVGAVGGAIGGVALEGAFSSFGMVGGGLANGFITGTVTGALSGALDGTNILKSVIRSAIVGGLIGGGTGLIRRLSIKSSDFQVPDTEYNEGESFKSQNELDNYVTENIGDLKTIEKQLRTDISLASPTNLPDGYGFQQNYMTSNGGIIGGNTNPVKGTGFFTPLRTEIRISPGIRGTYYSGVNAAKMIIRHEIVHAFHQFKGLGLSDPNFLRNSENAASAYSLAYAKTYSIKFLENFHRSTYASYPSIYSWRGILKQFPNINMGLK